ncbi:hypothetical protein M422DRAFT_61135 [Sphaerobolus stellatus SS14]|uniref:HNH domain-containing protein n=1 Tax=Sphaerobolus stellatus (strain SS14) TaxID=990650 RepID=A0A0C9UPZ3_SPHS4|nr:hypothetical protein M422DRAFT_190898 [Sphaerobolus stellatus SS14]KIJ36627.1 hypothetical protein M422DRAFT_61135 [Sphaerobolus stellatus SS14]
MTEETSSQFSLFKDCIARRVMAHPSMSSEADDSLDDFSAFLASEAWSTLPSSLKSATNETKSAVPDLENIPLDTLSGAFTDTLLSYEIAADEDEVMKFLRRALEEYIEEACAAPPVWVRTRAEECEICGRAVPLTYHHLIPRSTHTKVLKKGWHSENMINSVAWLCRSCHSTVHRAASNEDLARYFYTVELLLEREDIQKWQKYAAKQRFGVKWKASHHKDLPPDA